jgi:protoporphyrinogen oxidase
MPENFDYVVVGGGLAGISATLHLQDLGAEVVLLESSDRLGGRIATDNIDGFLCDRGFQLINSKYSSIVELDVIDEIDFIPAPRAIEVAVEDKRHAISDPRSLSLSFLDRATGTLPEKLALIRIIFSKPKANASIGEVLSVLGTTYERTLRPFLHGVFLADPYLVDAQYGISILRSFVSGSPGIPRKGVGQLPLALGKRLHNVELNTRVERINGRELITSEGTIEAKKIIVATDAMTATQLLDYDLDTQMVGCITWYHVCDSNPSGSGRLLVDSQPRGPVINCVVISDISPEYAPKGQYLLSTTSTLGASESDVKRHLTLMWGVDTRSWQLLAKYEIPLALPLQAVGKPLSQNIKLSDHLFLTGDHRSVPSQQGALFSGKLAGELAFN